MAITRPVVSSRAHVVDPSRATATDWRTGLPQFRIAGAGLRELRLTDAASLAAALATPQVARFISAPPTSADAFARFIAWTAREQLAGRYVCFAIVPPGREHAAGIIQVRPLEPGFGVAEWGF